MTLPTFEHLLVTLDDQVATISLNRPKRANALHLELWFELKAAFEWLDGESTARVGVITGQGNHFCAGIDLGLFMGLQEQIQDPCHGRMADKVRGFILKLQDCLTAIERCRKPVIAAIHGSCIGGALDLIAACDLRYCAADARFSLKELDLGLVADVGVLQRLPRIIGDGRTRELAFTAREFYGPEALQMGLVSQCLPDKDAMLAVAQGVAKSIALKSPLTVRGLKENLNFSRDHSVEDGLKYVASWNASMLLSEDLMTAAMAMMTKDTATFRD